MVNLNADIRPALRYVRLNISETQSNLNGTLNDFVAGNDTINTSMQGRFVSEEKGKHISKNQFFISDGRIISVGKVVKE